MKILLLNPPFFKKYSREQRSPGVTKSGTLYFPMWLAYGAAYLEKKGHEILLLDAPADDLSYESVEGKGREYKPELLVVSTSTPSIYNDVKIAARLKQSLGGPFTTLVGTHVSACPEESLGFEPSIDAVARREFETILADLAQALGNGGSLASVAGLTYRRNGQIVSNPDALLLENLDEIPFVSKIYRRFL
ncbi:MAG: cobalamin B12-binding domain-containing protein, partial [Candidatus Lindowbacteria bacterium]|nr:cobalamin B12-binding domain-containing protein [Candidatus Lindowbacteria bacterium]